MNDDDLPPQPHAAEESAANDFGQLMGAGMWIAVFFAAAGAIFYIVTRLHG